jgi:tRNA G26 N,N-dimethylase Trm1
VCADGIRSIRRSRELNNDSRLILSSDISRCSQRMRGGCV